MVTDGNWTYYGYYLEMYRNIESLYCALLVELVTATVENSMELPQEGENRTTI